MKFMPMLLISIGLAGSFPIVSVASESGADGDSHKETFRTSLHGTRYGHDTFWKREHGGIEALIERPIDDFGCKGCHPGTLADGTPVDPFTYKPSCADCHVDPYNPTAEKVTNDICLKCHSRQGAEEAFLKTETHVNLAHEGFACVTCHTSREMHGDENVYSSLLAPDAMDTKCERCHTVYSDTKTDIQSYGADNVNVYHKIHQETVDCSSCHVQSVVACNSCHLDSVLEGKQVFAGPPHQNFRMLVRHDGKVHTATYMTVTYENERTFNVIAPYYAHAITKDGISCGDCHGNSAVKEYNETGKIRVITWDNKKKVLVGREGVIPVPYDWKEALRFDYVVPTPNPDEPWMLLKGDTDLSQMLFGRGLSRRQMDFLRNPLSGD